MAGAAPLLRRWLGPLLAIGLLLVAGAAAVRVSYTVHMRLIEDRARATLTSTADLIATWQREQTKPLLLLARNPEFIALLKPFSLRTTPAEFSDPAVTRLNHWLANSLPQLGYGGYLLFAADMSVAATIMPEFQGQKLAPQALLTEPVQRAFAGANVVGTPFPSAMNGTLFNGETFIAGTFHVPICIPIRDEEVGRWVFCAREALDVLNEILRSGRNGTTGEAYLVNREGRLITPSRFISVPPIDPATIHPGGPYPSLWARVPAPGNSGAALIRMQPDTQSQPTAILARARDAAPVFLAQYLDYRGTTVIGAALWLPELRATLVVEQDYREAFAPYLFTRNIVGGLIGVAIALVVLLSLLNELTRRRRVAHENELQQLNRDLEHKVDERTHALELARRDAEAASQAKANFLAAMSHEIRTPLNAILGLSNLAQKSDVDGTRNYLTRIHQSGQHLLTLINGILDYSKLEAGKIVLDNAPFSLTQLLEQCASFVSERAREKGLALNIERDAATVDALRGDAMRLGQILINFLSNAVKFTSIGSVVLRAQQLRCDAETVRLRLSVSDTGIGIPPAEIEKLFEPFTQVDNSSTRQFEGTGLGLAICKDIAELLQTDLHVNSSVGRGSTFSIELTLARNLAPPATKHNTPVTVQPSWCGRRVLLAEDNAINREVAIDVLQTLGLEVIEAVDGLDAIDKILHDRFDLVLMDVQMPRLDGYSATAQIRRQPQFATLPIIAMTANALPGDRDRCLQAGMNDYIAKPFEPHTLLALLQRWLPTAPLHPAHVATTKAATTGTTAATAAAQFDRHRMQALGFNTAKALSYLLDDETLYRDVLGRFYREYAQIPEQVQQAFNAGEFTRAAELVHSIKALVATLGAEQLHAVCATVERALRERRASAAMLAEFQREFARVRNAIGSVVPNAA